jgi:ABC-type branched-subunit amino acid transport system ATPase component
VTLLTVEHVAVRFGGLQALSDVDIEVPVGEVTGLIGPNGAGKTTLFNVITGLQAPTNGRLLLDDRDITTMKPHKRARIGVGRTFQRLETFGSLSVRENILVAAEMKRGYSREKFSPGDLADELIARIGLENVAGARVEKLPTGTQRLIEIARALATKPKLLLLDEPSSGLNEHETEELSELLRELADTGLGILLVEHDMAMVMTTCHHINVLDFGQIIAYGTPEEVQANPIVRAAYLGEGDEKEEVPEEQAALLEEVSALQAEVHAETDVVGAGPDGDTALPSVTVNGTSAPPSPVASQEAAAGEVDPGAALQLHGIRAGYGSIDVLHGLNISIPPGQVYALLGPNGAGKTTTLKVAGGIVSPNAGDVYFQGQRINGKAPDALARAGLCTVPEGRGIFPNLTVLENLRTMTYTGTSFSDIEEAAYTRFPRLKERRKQLAGTLSGGEQMLAIARAIATKPKVLMLDELSMGLAPLVVSELYDVVKRIAAEDVSILVVEQFAHEVLGVADVAAVILHGSIQKEGEPAEVAEVLQEAYLGGAVG